MKERKSESQTSSEELEDLDWELKEPRIKKIGRLNNNSSQRGQILDTTGISSTLQAVGEGGGRTNEIPHILAFSTPKLTNTQSKPITKTLKKTTSQQTLLKSEQKTYRTLISCVEDFLVKHSQSLERGEVFKIPEEHSFLRLRELLKLKDLKLFSLKMSKGYSITTKGKLLEQSFKRFQNWGIMFNGWFLTASFLEFPKTERGYSLSEVLEENVDQKYYLSEKSMKSIIKNNRNRSNI